MYQFLTAAVIFAAAHDVVTATEARIEDFPYQVSLEENGFFFCGGAIISQSHIITSTNCVASKSPLRIQVRVGSATLRNGGQLHGVSQITAHPQYKVNQFDIAILRLSQPVQAGPGIAPVQLPLEHEILPDRSPVTVSGWGGVAPVSYYRDRFPAVLQSAQITTVNREKCQFAYKEIARNVGEDNLCAGAAGEGEDACQSDTGGPLVFNGKLYGVASWGGICKKWHTPTVYASVVASRGFIRDVVGV